MTAYAWQYGRRLQGKARKKGRENKINDSGSGHDSDSASASDGSDIIVQGMFTKTEQNPPARGDAVAWDRAELTLEKQKEQEESINLDTNTHK